VVLRGAKIFAFGWRNTFSVFEAVVIAEEAQVKVTPFHLIKVDLVRPTITGWKVFKEKDLGNKATEHSIPQKEGLEILTDLLKFLLNAAYKNS